MSGVNMLMMERQTRLSPHKAFPLSMVDALDPCDGNVGPQSKE